MLRRKDIEDDKKRFWGSEPNEEIYGSFLA